MFDLSLVLSALATGSYTVTRHSPGALDTATGKYPAGSTSTFVVIGNLQPVSGYRLRMLRELYSSDDIAILRTVTLLSIGDDSTHQRPDRVTLNGQTYEVVKVDDWQPNGNFYAATLALR